jgi:hypothetical protein
MLAGRRDFVEGMVADVGLIHSSPTVGWWLWDGRRLQGGVV